MSLHTTQDLGYVVLVSHSLDYRSTAACELWFYQLASHGSDYFYVYPQLIYIM